MKSMRGVFSDIFPLNAPEEVYIYDLSIQNNYKTFLEFYLPFLFNFALLALIPLHFSGV